MNIVRKVITGAVLVMFAAGVAAGEGKGMKGKMPAFSDFDLDGDGVMTEQEFNEGHAKRMSEMAAEGHELKNAGKCSFAEIDTDSDGAVTPEEFSAHKAQLKHKGKHKCDKCDHKCEDKEKCEHKHGDKHKHKEKVKEEVKEEVKG
jgi:hypothetical protein